jgi:hypothetical protein
MEDEKENVKEFFKNSALTSLIVENDYVIMTANGHSIIAEVADVGEYDLVIGRNHLAESAFKIEQKPHEARVLEKILGNYDVLPIGQYICVGHADNVMLLKNTQLKYKESRVG